MHMAPWTNASSSSSGGVLSRMTAVSYTHLDVYKRQIQRGVKFPCDALFRDGRLIAWLCPCREQANLLVRDGVELAADVYPVSYTHLDVYKRQALPYSAGCWRTLLFPGLRRFCTHSPRTRKPVRMPIAPLPPHCTKGAVFHE